MQVSPSSLILTNQSTPQASFHLGCLSTSHWGRAILSSQSLWDFQVSGCVFQREKTVPALATYWDRAPYCHPSHPGKLVGMCFGEKERCFWIKTGKTRKIVLLVVCIHMWLENLVAWEAGWWLENLVSWEPGGLIENLVGGLSLNCWCRWNLVAKECWEWGLSTYTLSHT